jgi:hypothetical protein
MLEICIQTSYDQNVQLILKSYLPVVYGTSRSHYGSKVPAVTVTVFKYKTTERKAAMWVVNL